MPTRDELKALIDDMPDEKLILVHKMLEFHLHPPLPSPQMEHIQRRNTEYRQRVMKQFQENRKPGTLGTGGGSSFASTHEGVPFSRQGFHYWDDKALVNQSLQNFDGQEIEIMERLSFSSDRTALICSLEIASDGHIVRHEDAFPISKKKEQP